MKLHSAPNVLIMQLDRNPFASKKIQNHVAFSSSLDLRPWMHSSSSELAGGVSLDYDLVAIIVHAGRSFSKGHNTAVCRLGSTEGKHTSSCTEMLKMD